MLACRKHLLAVALVGGQHPTITRTLTVRPVCRRLRCNLRQLTSQSSFSEPIIDEKSRKELLQSSLKSLDIDPDQLDVAATQSITDPIKGYDGSYGKSAIKTYRAFIYPKSGPQELDAIQLQAAARRTALQIQFLLARHRSHQEEWIRHHDSEDTQLSVHTFPLMLLLDNLRSANNVGNLLRTADAAGVRHVLTCGITPHPGGNGADKLRKTALGADAIVPSRHFETTRQGMDYVRDNFPEFAVIGMETTAQSMVYTEHDFSAHSGVCLVLGNEVTGVDTELLSQCHAIVQIPMFGTKNSLNVAACAPIVLYEIIRQWNGRSKSEG